jgi:hypothetical protein
MLRVAAMTAFVVVAAIIPAIWLTILLLPFWTWIEVRFGIESVGHSGPADWCYWTTYAACIVVAITISFVTRLVPRGKQ